MDRLERVHKNEERRKRLARKWALRLGAGLAGLILAKLCDVLPEEHQFLCHLSAKVFSFLAGTN